MLLLLLLRLLQLLVLLMMMKNRSEYLNVAAVPVKIWCSREHQLPQVRQEKRLRMFALVYQSYEEKMGKGWAGWNLWRGNQ